MMRQLNITTTTTMNRLELLEKLRTNRAEHKQIIAEAIVGFYANAVAQLQDALDQAKASQAALKAGEPPRASGRKNVHVSLEVPRDMTKAYDTVISMMESNVEQTVKLSASEYRMLVMDEWDWSHQFLVLNSSYSATARSKLGDPGDF